MDEGRVDELRIKIPESFMTLRMYLYSFLNLIEVPKYEVGQYIILRGKNIMESIIEGVKIVNEVIEERRSNQSLSKLKIDALPMSGNDKKIFAKLCSELNCELDPVQIFKVYIDILRSKGIDRLKEGLERFGASAKGYSLPSIFKLELYGLTRTTLFKDGFSMDPMMKVSLDFLLFMLAGYMFSRVGRARFDEKSWVSIHVFPTELAWSKSSWQRLQGKVSGLWSGVRPVDALLLYLLINLWDLLKDEPRNLVILGIADPAGSKPAAVSITINAPLKDMYIRAGNKLSYLLEQEFRKEAFIQLVKKALDVSQSNRGIAERFVKLLFLSLQDDNRALEELLLLSSRLEVATSKMKHIEASEREILNIARSARMIAKELIIHRT